jgi:DNA polymerase
MSRGLYPHEKSHSLDAQAKREGLGVKGDEVVRALGKRYADFTPEQLAAYGSYCCNDVDLTYALFMRYMALGFPAQELKLIDMTTRMFVDTHLELDPELLVKHLQEVQAHKQQLGETLRDRMLEAGNPDFTHIVFTEGMAGIKKVLMSNDKFAAALEAFGVVPPRKISPSTGKLTWAFAKTDPGMQELQEHPDISVQALVAARLGIKTTIEETRTERFIGMASRGKFPVPLRYYGAHSARWSGIESVNLQNLPSRGVNAGKLKRAIKAPPGYVLIDCDSSQIEARTLAWLAGQQDLVDAFAAKQDVYKLTASSIYGVAPDQVTKLQRQVGKTVVLGCGFGVGAVKVRMFLKTQAGVEVSEAEAKRIVNIYRSRYPHIPELWQRAQESLRALILGQSYTIDVPGICRTETLPGRDVMGITQPSGLWIQYPGLTTVMRDGKPEAMYLSKGVPIRIFGPKVVENVTQGIARCIVAEQALRIKRRYPVVLMVHDAAACVVPKAEQEEAAKYVEECMSWVPEWAPGLPLACEYGVGESYGDC